MTIRALQQHLELLRNLGIKELFHETTAKQELLESLRAQYSSCEKCPLHANRNKFVYGEGNPDAIAMVIGEGPGEEEDKTGRPFVGRAGALLDKMLLAIDIKREDVYIANIVKCRPPGNRNPEADEIAACERFLVRQLEALRPRVIVALGKFAAQWLSGRRDAPISALRGKFHDWRGVKVMATYHPAFLLRSPSQKRVVWEDLQLVMQELERLGVNPPHPPAA